MSIQQTNSIEPGTPPPDQTLTAQIAAFTRSAEERLPPEYLDAFRALISRLAEEGIGRSAPETGAGFPDFELQDDVGTLVRGSELWSDRTLVVKFYRGGWCPYCNLELAALQKHSEELTALGVELLAVAPERPTAIAATKQKASAGFSFLWDRDSRLARKLGISFEVDATVRDIYGRLGIDLSEVNGAWELPIPATFVVRKGRVRFRHIDLNYLQRQDPIDLIAILRADAQRAD